jgi:thioredoxin 2
MGVNHGEGKARPGHSIAARPVAARLRRERLSVAPSGIESSAGAPTPRIIGPRTPGPPPARHRTMDNSSSQPTDSVLVACPQCHSVVRTPSDRMTEHPKCPRCKSALFAGEAIPLDESSFATHTSRGTLPILVDFWAPWCGPCQMMAPVLERLAQSRAASVQVGKVNTDEQQGLAARFNIRSIPTLILYREGREVARHSGAVDGAALGRWLDGALRS